MSISDARIALSQLQEPATRQNNAKHHPDYWNSDPSSLLSRSDIHDITLGTGHDIFRTTIIPAIKQARFEVILVTCFWARSATLQDLNDALCHLSTRALQDGMKIKVRICFSSSSLFQKLLHTSSLKGTTYKLDALPDELGFPAPKFLEGLDLEVKSIFVLPFSVMHPKFVVIDRQRVILPSCNVSWEDWLEGCVVLGGSIVGQFVTFWQEVWASKPDERGMAIPTGSSSQETTPPPPKLNDIASIFLPSPHHTDPQFSLPWQDCPQPPPTPLNVYLLTLFTQAQHRIYIQTPNLTSPPVLSALRTALARGIDITILTSARLMVFEQLVTAGTTTSRCVQHLIRQHRRMLDAPRAQGDLEAALPSPVIGNLRVSYYEPRDQNQRGQQELVEPIQSHFKLTIFDDQVVVLGSGNLDRASWFTSQELGVAFFSEPVAKTFREKVTRAMEGRRLLVYDG